ncbi:MAG: sugar phosphate isomerase/epimerase [Oscillospiraceae bacterium]|nr:sugar phosphate isomerase/epimerase [Oscillospiraceae bacterium]
MKYSFMSFSCPDAGIDKFFSIANMYGYDGIEPRIDAGHNHGIELGSDKQYLKEVRKKSAEAKIEICCIATSCEFANAETWQENVEAAKYAVELAAEVDASAIRVFGGGIPKSTEREKSLDLIVGALTQISEYASLAKVNVCLETHDSWCAPQTVADIMEQVNRPHIAVNWDIMHPVLQNFATVEKSFEILKPWIKHIHIHDGVLTNNSIEFKAIGEGIIDHATAIKLLKTANYDGYISGEWIDWESYEICLPRELVKLKYYEER